MKKIMHIQLILAAMFLVVALPGCGSSDSGSVTVVITCTSSTTDASCFMNNLVLKDENGDDVTLVDIYQGLPAADTTTGTAPIITSISPASMIISNTTTTQGVAVEWTDPLGTSTPAFCIQLCPASSTVCTTIAKSSCTRAIPDGFVSGTWRTFLGYNASPAGEAGTTEQLVMRITPLTTSDGSDPIGLFEDYIDAGGDISDDLGTDSVLVGQSVQMNQTLVPPESTDGGGDGGDGDGGGGGTGVAGTSCTSSSDCIGNCFSTRACVDSLTCSCEGTSSPGTCFDTTVECSTSGVCGDGIHACCVGYSCVNGSCKNSGSCL